MNYIVTAEEMQNYDHNTIKMIGIPQAVLMERAALEVKKCILDLFPGTEHKGTSILIACGYGNNGGDGLALARVLIESGFSVSVLKVGNPDKKSEGFSQQEKILENYPCTFVNDLGGQYDCYVDALLGVGLNRELTGIYRDTIEELNNCKGIKIAVDVPSGVDSTTGKIWGTAFIADHTVTFGFIKRGLLLYPGAGVSGKVLLGEIGINKFSFGTMRPKMLMLDEPMDKLLPKRDPNGNKSTFGKILLIAGSNKMAGACILAARAIYKCGSGMVKIISAPENREIIQTSLPEALYGDYSDLQSSLEWSDVVCIGPGIGREGKAIDVVDHVIKNWNGPLVMDADALNICGERRDIYNVLRSRGDNSKVVLTPHLGELSRLSGVTIDDLKIDICNNAATLSKELGCTIVAKDSRTICCAPKHPICINTSGNSGMATAGSGDVLAGIIASLMGQGYDGYKAASFGVRIHALAGDKYAKSNSQQELTASDIITSIDA